MKQTFIAEEWLIAVGEAFHDLPELANVRLRINSSDLVHVELVNEHQTVNVLSSTNTVHDFRASGFSQIRLSGDQFSYSVEIAEVLGEPHDPTPHVLPGDQAISPLLAIRRAYEREMRRNTSMGLDLDMPDSIYGVEDDDNMFEEELYEAQVRGLATGDVTVNEDGTPRDDLPGVSGLSPDLSA